MHTKYSEIKPSTLFELCKALSHVIDEQSFSMLFGALWLGEEITLSLLGALAMVFVGISLVDRRKPVAEPEG